MSKVFAMSLFKYVSVCLAVVATASNDHPSSSFSLASEDSCDAAKCNKQCECATSKCDVPTCLKDADCASLFKCAVPKCPCGAGNLPCVEKCMSASPSVVTNQTLSCFKRNCPSSPFPLATEDSCDAAKCNKQCECATSKCDVPTCLKDADCASLFKCAVPKCPCGAGNLPCVEKCMSASPSNVTKQTLSCFKSNCPSSPFSFATEDSCDAAKCNKQCECATSKCDVPTCLKDADCANLFKCAVPKCPCGAGNLPCVEKCMSASPSDVTNRTLNCFKSNCPSYELSDGHVFTV